VRRRALVHLLLLVVQFYAPSTGEPGDDEVPHVLAECLADAVLADPEPQ
jgi:hypothetical protein